MEELAKLIPSLPSWVSVPLIILTVLSTLGPKIFQSMQDIISWNRLYQREKMRLELLKLQYEIEALKKEKGLDTILDNVLSTESGLPPTPVEQDLEDREALGPLKRFIYGTGGALLPIVLNLLLFNASNFTSGGVEWIGVALRLVVFAALAGFASLLLTKHYATRVTCFLIGLSLTLLLTMLVNLGDKPVRTLPLT